MFCNESGEVIVEADELLAYEQGALLQDAFPNLPAGAREQLKTGTHDECWDKFFGEEE